MKMLGDDKVRVLRFAAQFVPAMIPLFFSLYFWKKGWTEPAITFMLLGSVDISSQSDNRQVCTGAWSFVGVGFPNPLVTHHSPFRLSRFYRGDQGRF